MGVMKTIGTVALLMLFGLPALAQEQEPPQSSLQGKVGRRFESSFATNPNARPLDLDRLEIPDEVRREFVDRLQRRLDDDELEALHQRRMRRLQGRGQSDAEGSRLDQDGDEEKPVLLSQRRQHDGDGEDEGSTGLYILGGMLLAVSWLIWRMRR